MGTLLSTLPATFNSDQQWADLDECFQTGLLAAAASKPLQPNRASSSRVGPNQRNVSGILRKSSNNAIEVPRKVQLHGHGLEGLHQNIKKAARAAVASRLPTPVIKTRKQSERSSTTTLPDLNENLDQNKNKVSTPIIRTDNNGNERTYVERAFFPEPWPSNEIIQEHLQKRLSEPTTFILARFIPRNTKTYIEIKYSSNKTTGEKLFECLGGRMDSLFTTKEGYELGESDEHQIEYFIRIFKACINFLPGNVWWNGLSLVYDQNSAKNRLKVGGFELEPSQMLFELTNMKDFEIHRSTHKIELRGLPNGGTEEDIKYIRFRGMNMKDVKVSKLRGNLITVHVPEYFRQ